MHATTITRRSFVVREFFPAIVVSPGMVFISTKSCDEENKAIAVAEADMRKLHSQIETLMNNRGYLLRKRGE